MHRGWWGWDFTIAFLLCHFGSRLAGDPFFLWPTAVQAGTVWLPRPAVGWYRSALVSSAVGVWWPAVFVVAHLPRRCLQRPLLVTVVPLDWWASLANLVLDSIRGPCPLVHLGEPGRQLREERGRLVSFAFSNYRNYSLRNTDTSSPTNLRRRRLQTTPLRTSGPAPDLTGLSPLAEGPVTPLGSRYGSDAGRANGLSTLADVAAWAGTDGEVDEELMKALGKPTKLRDIAFINRAVWDRTAGALDLCGPTGHGYNSGNQGGAWEDWSIYGAPSKNSTTASVRSVGASSTKLMWEWGASRWKESNVTWKPHHNTAIALPTHGVRCSSSSDEGHGVLVQGGCDSWDSPLGEGQQAGEVQEKERLFRYRTHLYSQEERLSQEEEEV